LYYTLPKETQEATLTQARKYAKAMKAPLIFCSSALGINVLKLFKLIFEKVFGLDIDVEKHSNLGEPILEY
jgi:GTP-binding protein of the ras superfamily involved in termination of M-phase